MYFMLLTYTAILCATHGENYLKQKINGCHIGICFKYLTGKSYADHLHTDYTNVIFTAARKGTNLQII